MAAILQPPLFLSIFLLFTILPLTFSQSTSPQNIQTFYPISSPPTPTPTPPETLSPPPLENPILPPSSPSRSSTRAAVGRAIGITAASTIVVSGLLFFFLLRRSQRKRKREDADLAAIAAGRNRNGGNSVVPIVPIIQNDNFVRVEGNVKGVIVDENGLDVLYWKKLEEGEKRRSFNKQYYRMKSEYDKEEEKMIIKEQIPVQESPLLRGKSSTSQSPSWLEKDEIVELKNIEPALSFKVADQERSSVQLMPMSSPPLPLPPRAQPPPPPPIPFNRGPAPPPVPPPIPVQNIGAIPKVNATVPPPPPPVPFKKGPGPPPPPPPAGASVRLPPPLPKGRSVSVGEGTSSSKGNAQVKLKPLHWDKVNPNVEHSMVWDKLDKGSFKFDGDMMEALFGYVATNRKSPRAEGSSPLSIKENKAVPASRIFILDNRKSQNIAIVLKSLNVSRGEIIHALTDGNGLNADALEKLTRITPTDEETTEILSFDGDTSRLADAESFLYHLLKSVPSAFTRFNAMLFRSNYDSEVSQLKESLLYLESACNELRTRGLFLKLLEAVLKAGNRLNAGTSRGNAQAFNLTALRKLSDVKSSDGKTTLLQFVVQEVVRAEGKRCVLNRSRSLTRTNSQSGAQSLDESASKDDREREYMKLGLPVIGGLSSEFSNVKKAATLDHDLITKTSSGLASQLTEIQKILIQCRQDPGFAREMKGFLDKAEMEMKFVKEEQERVMGLVKRTTDYYQAGSSKDKAANPLQLFTIVRDFLGMVDQVCIDIARNVQKRKPAAPSAPGSSSPESESPRVFRFPKLPANFMSEGSKSSDSDDESDVR